MENRDWERRLLPAAWRRTRESTNRGIIFATALALATITISALAVAGPGVVALLAIGVAVAAILLVQLVLTHLDMLYEVRKAVGGLLNPAAPHAADFEVVDEWRPSGQVDLKVANHGAPGRVTVRVVGVDGLNEQHDTPWTVPWDATAVASAEIGRDDERTIRLVHVRYIGRLDFTQVHGSETRLVSPGAACETEPCTVRVDLEVRNDVGGGVGSRKALSLALVLRDRAEPIDIVVRQDVG